jgi:uncharacterized protein YpiB (UPF0302 family)
MSIFQFLASDKLLGEVKNPYVKFISINEALTSTIKLASSIVNDTESDRNERDIKVYDSEEHMEEIEINHDMYYSSKYAKKYSNKQYFSELHWAYTGKRAKQLVDYLKEQLNNLDEIEVWSIWLDEYKSPSIKSININELSVTDLEFLNTFKGYEKPKCLIIKR